MLLCPLNPQSTIQTHVFVLPSGFGDNLENLLLLLFLAICNNRLFPSSTFDYAICSMEKQESSIFLMYPLKEFFLSFFWSNLLLLVFEVVAPPPLYMRSVYLIKKQPN